MKSVSLKSAIVSILAVGMLGLAMTAFAAGKNQDKGKVVTVQGEVLDLACYLDHGARGKKHQQCALMCLKGGQPMGLITKSGKVYLLLADHQDYKPFNEAKNYAADQVEITGPVAEKSGLTGLTVEKVKKL